MNRVICFVPMVWQDGILIIIMKNICSSGQKTERGNFVANRDIVLQHNFHYSHRTLLI